MIPTETSACDSVSRRRSNVYGIIGAAATLSAVGVLGLALSDSPESEARLTAEPARIAPAVPYDDQIADRTSELHTSSTLGQRPDAADGEPESVTGRVEGESTTTIDTLVAPRSQPLTVATSRIDLSAFPIRSVGLEPNGELEVPDETEIGWYEYGAAPGEPGATVLAAHVSWNRQLGPFAQLATMEPGDTVTTRSDDGSVREYVVVERAMYPKDQLPNERLWRNVGDESLVLITCGGSFDDSINRYRENIVVYAEPASASEAGRS